MFYHYTLFIRILYRTVLYLASNNYPRITIRLPLKHNDGEGFLTGQVLKKRSLLTVNEHFLGSDLSKSTSRIVFWWKSIDGRRLTL
jgi:hypothetical protein